MREDDHLREEGDLHSRRQVARFVNDPEAVQKLFATIGPWYAERHGGYTGSSRRSRLGDAGRWRFRAGEDEGAARRERAAREKAAARASRRRSAAGCRRSTAEEAGGEGAAAEATAGAEAAPAAKKAVRRRRKEEAAARRRRPRGRRRRRPLRRPLRRSPRRRAIRVPPGPVRPALPPRAFGARKSGKRRRIVTRPRPR